MKTKRAFTKEFKKQAVELAKSLGNTTMAAKQLGIRDTLIHSWKSKFGAGNSSGLSESERDEIKRLRKENAELKKVNYILKGAAAFFSQDHLK